MKQNIVIAIIVIIALALGALYVLGDGDIFAGLSGIFEDIIRLSFFLCLC